MTRATATLRMDWFLAASVTSSRNSEADKLPFERPQTSAHCLLLVIAPPYRSNHLDMIHEAAILDYLGLVDELGKRNVRVSFVDVDGLEGRPGSVLEAESEEVTEIRGRTSAELNCESRGEFS